MAHAAGDALDFPLYGAHYRLTFPIFDADGDLVTAAGGLDSEVSKDAGNWADCTNEATEINSGGMYYLDLTETEMSAKTVAVVVKTTSTGAKTTPMVIYPKRLPVLVSGTAQGGANGSITLTSGASAQDDFYNGMFVVCTNNDPTNVQGQARRIIDYAGSTKVATVESNWGTNPTSATTYEILVPETVQVGGWAGSALAETDTAGYPVVTIKDGTGQGELNIASGVVDANVEQIDTVATAATNLSDAFDGTGGVELKLSKLTVNNPSGAGVSITGTTVGLDVTASAGPGIAAASSGGNGAGIAVTGNGSGGGMVLTGGATGDGMRAFGGATQGNGLYLYGKGSSRYGLFVEAAADNAVYAVVDSGNHDAVLLSGTGTGSGLKLSGGATDAPGLFIDGGGTAKNIDPTTMNEIADALLDRNMASGTDSGAYNHRTPRQALRLLRNKWYWDSTTLHVTKEDDTTDSWTAEGTVNASADPITAVDPASS